MYNGKIISKLLKERNLSPKALLSYLGVKDNGSVTRFMGPDIKASRLEQIADFFGLSIDTFFTREYKNGDNILSIDGAVATSGGHAEYHAVGKISSRVREQADKIKFLEAKLKAADDSLKDKETILKEKDSRIQLLERMLNILESKQ